MLHLNYGFNQTVYFLDSHAVSFNRALDVCKLTGAVLFCVGGTSMAVGLLLSAFAKSYSKEELYLQRKFKERLADLHATVGKVSFSTCLIMTHGGIKVKMPDRRISIIVIYFTVTLFYEYSTN